MFKIEPVQSAFREVLNNTDSTVCTLKTDSADSDQTPLLHNTTKSIRYLKVYFTITQF